MPISHSLYLRQQTISSLRDLQPFFTKVIQLPDLSSEEQIIAEAEAVLDNDLVEAAANT